MKIHIGNALSALVFTVSQQAAFAAGEIGTYTPPSGLPGGENMEAASLVSTLVSAFLPLASGVAALLLIFAGIQYALAAGDEEKMARAKRTAKWTLVGLVLALTAYAIVAMVTKVFG